MGTEQRISLAAEKLYDEIAKELIKKEVDSLLSNGHFEVHDDGKEVRWNSSSIFSRGHGMYIILSITIEGKERDAFLERNTRELYELSSRDMLRLWNCNSSTTIDLRLPAKQVYEMMQPLTNAAPNTENSSDDSDAE